MNRRILALLASSLLGILAGCSSDAAYVLVSAYSSKDAIPGVAQLRVYATLGGKQDVLYYPKAPTAKLKLDQTTPVTFSVGFGEKYEGLATIEVEALSTENKSLGYGRSTAQVAEGKVVKTDVRLAPAAVRIAIDGTTAASCVPTNPVATCGQGLTCGLASCAAGEPIDGLCFPAGPGAPGETCTNNSDCTVGSQCFSFEEKCQVRTCLRYCTADADCGEAGSFCNTPLPCGARLCSRPCDPTGSATQGCSPGLSCFIYGGETTDCSCPSSRAAGAVGATCTTDDQCAAGNICVLPQGKCNPACLRSAPTCPTGTTCTALTGYTRYGACL